MILNNVSSITLQHVSPDVITQLFRALLLLFTFVYLQKFQEVSAAYKKLTSNEKDYDDDDGMTLVNQL